MEHSYISVRRLLPCVNRHDTHNAGRSCLYHDPTGLVKFVCKDVFIVGKRDDELDDELTVAGYNSSACAPVGMFPPDPIILLVEADYIWRDRCCAVISNVYRVKVLCLKSAYFFNVVELFMLLCVRDNHNRAPDC